METWTWDGKLVGKYLRYYKEHYYATVVFHKVITHRLESKFEYSNNEFKSVLRFFHRFRYASGLKHLWYVILLITKPVRRNHIVLDISRRFEYLTSNFINAAEDIGLKSIIGNNPDKKLRFFFYLSIFSFSNRNISNLFKSVPASDFEGLLANRNLMLTLNIQILKQVKFISKVLIAYNTKLIIITDNLSPRKILLVESAKMAGIPCYSIPHGYPQTSFYHPIVCSDRVFTWNNQQQAEILREDPKKQTIVLGYPKLDEKSITPARNISDLIPNQITYLTAPLQIERQSVYEQLKILKDFGFIINIRLHPKERKNDSLFPASRRAINYYGFNLSERSMLEDILSSRVVIGSMTSVLYEALLINGNPIQLISEEFNLTPFYSSIVSMDIKDLQKLKDSTEIDKLIAMNSREPLVSDFHQRAAEIFSFHNLATRKDRKPTE